MSLQKKRRTVLEHRQVTATEGEPVEHRIGPQDGKSEDNERDVGREKEEAKLLDGGWRKAKAKAKAKAKKKNKAESERELDRDPSTVQENLGSDGTKLWCMPDAL